MQKIISSIKDYFKKEKAFFISAIIIILSLSIMIETSIFKKEPYIQIDIDIARTHCFGTSAKNVETRLNKKTLETEYTCIGYKIPEHWITIEEIITLRNIETSKLIDRKSAESKARSIANINALIWKARLGGNSEDVKSLLKYQKELKKELN